MACCPRAECRWGVRIDLDQHVACWTCRGVRSEPSVTERVFLGAALVVARVGEESVHRVRVVGHCLDRIQR